MHVTGSISVLGDEQLGQNRPLDDQRSMLEALEGGDSGAVDLARLIADRLDG